MKICKALFLLGIFFANAQSNGGIFTTSHVEKVNQRQRGKNIRPKEHFCSQGKIEKIKCSVQSSDACKLLKIESEEPVCAFDRFGVKFDFKKECEACEHEDISYYFKSTCEKIPKICKKTQECVNGICVAILNDAEDKDRIVCNESNDCPAKTDLCVANKCIDKRELITKLSKAEKTNPELAQKNKRARKEAMRFQLQRRIKDFEGIKKLQFELKARKAARNQNQNQNQKRGNQRGGMPNTNRQIALN